MGKVKKIKFLFLIFLIIIPFSYAKDKKSLNDQIKNGKLAFEQKGCSACHQIGGDRENPIGPDLKNVTETRDRKWLIEWIQDPRKKQKENDPIYLELFKKFPINMPYIKLKDSEIKDILKFIRDESSKKKGK
jgi:hypothetical protein